jgi:hypothetical protein
MLAMVDSPKVIRADRHAYNDARAEWHVQKSARVDRLAAALYEARAAEPSDLAHGAIGLLLVLPGRYLAAACARSLCRLLHDPASPWRPCDVLALPSS